MKIYQNVQGQSEQAQAVIKGNSTVFIHDEIKLLPPRDDDNTPIYEYWEAQLTYEEYKSFLEKCISISAKETRVEDFELNEQKVINVLLNHDF